jgi:hypothetical protein
MYELNKLQKQGKFKEKRDKNVLSTANGSKEHRGCKRGLSKLTIKDGFQQDRASYRKHDRYKKKLQQAAEKAL